MYSYRFVLEFEYDGTTINEVTDWFNFEAVSGVASQIYLSDKPFGYLVVEDIDCTKVRLYDLSLIAPDSFVVKLERKA